MAGSGEAAAVAKAREHIEEMRRVRYSIGGDANQLSEDLHQAVKYLSAELYAKDAHFLMELIQAEKVEAVKHQLSNVHPEVLLFLAKIKQLSVREDNPDLTLSTVSAISITSETNYEERKNINAVSYTIHLSAQENYEGVEKE